MSPRRIEETASSSSKSAEEDTKWSLTRKEETFRVACVMALSREVLLLYDYQLHAMRSKCNQLFVQEVAVYVKPFVVEYPISASSSSYNCVS